ncbi:MAG: hypothetical protein V1912_10180 [bacterium]
MGDGSADHWYSRKSPEDRRPLLSSRLLWNILEFRHPVKVAGVLLAVVLTAAMAASLAIAIGGGDSTGVETTVAPAATQPVLVHLLQPARVACTSEFTSFPCSALIDDDPDNSWNAREGGIDAEITFFFSPQVQITEMVIYNLETEEAFARNAHMKEIEIVMDDLAQADTVELEDSNQPQRVELRGLHTSSLTITITSSYPGQAHEGLEPFGELAAQQILFYGRIVPDNPG